MKFKNVFLGIFASTLLLASCSNDDAIEKDVPLGTYDNGILVLNEGNFGTPNASVSYIANDFTAVNNIFGLENSDKKIGDIAQSISFFDDKAFIVVNNSNVIEVVNRYTFKSIATISGNLKAPRYSVVLNGKLYVTNNEILSVYDAKTFAYIQTITIGKTAEKIVAANGKLYIMNGAFGSGNAVIVVNPSSNNAISTIAVANVINSIEEKNGSVYVLCSNADGSKLFKINTNTDTATSIESTTLKQALNMDIDGDKIYYTAGTNVYAMALTAITFSETPLFSVADNSWSTFYGFSVIDGKIYSADANAFTAAGIVKIYSATGAELKTVTVGMGPNSFYANN